MNVSPYGRIRVYQIQGVCPLLKPDGSSWDNGAGDVDPDLYFRVYNSSGNDMISPGGYIYFNNTYNVQYPFNPALEITDMENPFMVKFLDYDPGSPAGDDVISEFSFRPADYFNSSGVFPVSFTKTNSLTGAIVTVKVIWAN